MSHSNILILDGYIYKKKLRGPQRAPKQPKAQLSLRLPLHAPPANPAVQDEFDRSWGCQGYSEGCENPALSASGFD